MKSPYSLLNAGLAIVAGLIVLIGYFIPALGSLREMVLRWAVILAGFALLVGILNLLFVHWKKVSQNFIRGAYSLVLIVAFFLTVIIVGITGVTGTWSLYLFENIQIPVENTLLAIMVVTLAFAAIRLMRLRTNLASFVFWVTLLIVLLASAPIYGFAEIPALVSLRNWISGVLSVAGARGILLGVALGTVAVGLRVLIGSDRPYGG